MDRLQGACNRDCRSSTTDQEKGEPTDHFITEMLTVEAAQDEKAGLTETLTREQAHHEIEPRAIYTDAGYVTEHTLTQAEQNGHGVIRSDASRKSSRQGTLQ